MTTLDRIAFLASDPRMVDYVRNVALELRTEADVIVDDVTGRGSPDVSLTAIAASGLDGRRLSEVLARGERYRVVVGQGKCTLEWWQLRRRIGRAARSHRERFDSRPLTRAALLHHPRALARWAYASSIGRTLEASGLADRIEGRTGRRFSGTRHRTRPRLVPRRVRAEVLLGDLRAHFPHGLDVTTGETVFEGTTLWHVALCHSVIDSAEKSRRWGVPTVLIGYPRYDHLASLPRRTVEPGTTERLAVLWMPTAGHALKDGDSIIELWLDAFASLARDADVTVRPHPKDVEVDPDLPDRLRAAGLMVDTDIARDVGRAIVDSDVVVCDRGGTMFSVLFLERPLVLLDGRLPHDPSELASALRSEVLTLRPTPSISDDLRAAVMTGAHTPEQRATRALWRDRVFEGAPREGARAAADALRAIRDDGIPST